MEYNLVICGGTFDRLHEGHKSFLRFAFSKGSNVLIGLTSDAYVSQYKKDANILPYKKRLDELRQFLKKEKILQRARIVSISDKFDETQIPDSKQIALLVSPETYETGLEINAKRVKNNLLPLTILTAPLTMMSTGEKISSSKIREGTIDRNGILLPSHDFLSHTLSVPHTVRELLHKPFGMLYKGEIPSMYIHEPKKIVSVGDVTTKRLHGMGIQQIVSVIDFSVERKKTNETLQTLGYLGNEIIETVKNPAGQIYPDVWKALLSCMKNLKKNKNTIIVVDGEEDLMTLPLILMLPLGFYLFYGQPALGKSVEKEGVVVLPITEELKQKTYSVLKQFVPK